MAQPVQADAAASQLVALYGWQPQTGQPTGLASTASGNAPSFPNGLAGWGMYHANINPQAAQSTQNAVPAAPQEQGLVQGASTQQALGEPTDTSSDCDSERCSQAFIHDDDIQRPPCFPCPLCVPLAQQAGVRQERG